MHRRPDFLIHGDSGTAVEAEIRHNLLEYGNWQGQVLGQSKDGHSLLQWLSITSNFDDDGKPQYYIATVVDINKRMEFEERLEHLAHHDPLTGLPNRNSLYERIRSTPQTASCTDVHRPGPLKGSERSTRS